jgi:16S rRNA (adenine1518-N6/adenine1519-N6)-dimethyltransferase
MDHAFKKSLGQNFLINKNIILRIISLLESDVKSVIEIGPGNGALTNEIINKFNNINLNLIEYDDNLITKLNDIKHDNLLSYKVIHQDAMLVHWAKITSDLPRKLNIISNLPYNVGTRIFLNLVKENTIYDKMILMFQKEVVDRIIAKKSSKDYSKLSVISQLYLNIKKEFDVGPKNFVPAPSVISSVITCVPRNVKYDFTFEDMMSFLNIVFSSRRKMIRVSMKNKIHLIPEEYHQERPEDLELDDFMRIVMALKL